MMMNTHCLLQIAVLHTTQPMVSDMNCSMYMYMYMYFIFTAYNLHCHFWEQIVYLGQAIYCLSVYLGQGWYRSLNRLVK